MFLISSKDKHLLQFFEYSTISSSLNSTTSICFLLAPNLGNVSFSIDPKIKQNFLTSEANL